MIFDLLKRTIIFLNLRINFPSTHFLKRFKQAKSEENVFLENIFYEINGALLPCDQKVYINLKKKPDFHTIIHIVYLLVEVNKNRLE